MQTFCLFAIPKNGVSDPANQINSWLAKNPLNNNLNSFSSSLPNNGKLPTLPGGISSWAAQQPIVPPDSEVSHRACDDTL